MFPGANGLPDSDHGAHFVVRRRDPWTFRSGPGATSSTPTSGAARSGGSRYTPKTPSAVATAHPAPVPRRYRRLRRHRARATPAGEPITYAWDLDGDGAYDDSTSATPTYTYAEPGNYTAGLQVTDTEGASGTTSVTVSAGNTAPVAVIDAPGSTLTWKVDDQIAFSGHATDAQEGALPASALSWSLILHHCPSGCHTHVIQTMDGIAGGSFLAPDHGYPAYLELRLTATDSEGAQSTTNVRLDPQTVTVELRSNPPGLVLARLARRRSPRRSPRPRSAAPHSRWSASSPQVLANNYYRFVGWSDGGAESHLVVVPDDTSFTANYEQVQGDPPPTAAAGKRRIGAVQCRLRARRQAGDRSPGPTAQLPLGAGERPGRGTARPGRGPSHRRRREGPGDPDVPPHRDRHRRTDRFRRGHGHCRATQIARARVLPHAGGRRGT